MIRIVRIYTLNAGAMRMVYFKAISLNVQMDRYFQMFQDVANMLIVIQNAIDFVNGKTILK